MRTDVKKPSNSYMEIDIVTEELSGKESSSDFDLPDEKIIDDNKEVFQCPKEGCTRVYSYKGNLTQHILTAHKQKLFACVVDGCKAELSTKRDLENHIKISHPGSVHKFKQPQTRSKSRDSKNQIQVKKQKVEKDSTQVLPTTSKVSEGNSKQIATDVPSNSELDSDVESVYSIEEQKEPEKKEKYVCSYPNCGQAFQRSVHLDRHEYKHSGVRKHICCYEGCSKSYTIITHLKRHINISHEKVEKTPDVKCGFEFCDKVFTSMQNMVRHMHQVHENPKVYKCRDCNEEFNRRIKLRRHEVTHTGVFPYNCSQCGKGFVQEYFLKIHACKSYKCDECQDTFDKWSKLVAHRDATKHKIIIHKCEECDKVFSSKNSLTEHKNSHANDKEVLVCPVEGCTRFYSYVRNLNQHIQTAHEGKRFPCTVEDCQMNFTSNKNLKQHIKSHSQKTKKREPKKLRAKRKDAGKRKTSALSKLSGVVLDSKLNKMVIEGSVEIEVDLPAAKEIQNAEGQEDDEDGDVEQVVILTTEDMGPCHDAQPE